MKDEDEKWKAQLAEMHRDPEWKAQLAELRRQFSRETAPRKYSHYFRESPSLTIDVYRILQLFEVSDPCLQHALKKVLAAGKRGSKDAAKDVQEAIDALVRWQEMRSEEEAAKK